MKTAFSRFTSLVLALALLAVLPTTASARASEYFDSYVATIYASGDGKVSVTYLVNATKSMTTLGASSIQIYEQQSSGVNTLVYTYTDLTKSDTNTASGTVTYQGVAGRQYYAYVLFYAKSGNGAEIKPYTTGWATAT